VAKTSAQIEKQKREAEKRKKLNKTILQIAREMPDDPPEPGNNQLPPAGTPGKKT